MRHLDDVDLTASMRARKVAYAPIVTLGRPERPEHLGDGADHIGTPALSSFLFSVRSIGASGLRRRISAALRDMPLRPSRRPCPDVIRRRPSGLSPRGPPRMKPRASGDGVARVRRTPDAGLDRAWLGQPPARCGKSVGLTEALTPRCPTEGSYYESGSSCLSPFPH